MSCSDEITVIVGAGLASAEQAGALRQQKNAGRILMVGEEPHLPYRQPPLSKSYLAGESSCESLQIRSEAAYTKLGIECRIGARSSGKEADIEGWRHTALQQNGLDHGRPAGGLGNRGW